jgi:GNAT superfamily N-acetyltransferase
MGWRRSCRRGIYQFNAEATGIGDGRWLRAAVLEEEGELVAGLAGWRWGGCGCVDSLWVRADRRGRGLGSRLLTAAEAEASARGCTQMVLSTHSFQAPEMYLRRGYVEVSRTIRGATPNFTWSSDWKDDSAVPESNGHVRQGSERLRR